jgi:hypothetical protein
VAQVIVSEQILVAERGPEHPLRHHGRNGRSTCAAARWSTKRAAKRPTVLTPISAAERADAGAQQLRLAAEALQSTRGAVACALDALQALLAALADRDQLGLDLPAALDRQANRIGGGASGHCSVQLLRSGAREGGCFRRSMGSGCSLPKRAAR